MMDEYTFLGFKISTHIIKLGRARTFFNTTQIVFEESHIHLELLEGE